MINHRLADIDSTFSANFKKSFNPYNEGTVVELLFTLVDGYLTFCRNLQSTGKVSRPLFCSTMWLRLDMDTFLLHLQMDELWMREFWGRERRKSPGSPKVNFMRGLEDTRSSSLMKAFTSLS